MLRRLIQVPNLPTVLLRVQSTVGDSSWDERGPWRAPRRTSLDEYFEEEGAVAAEGGALR